MKRTQISQTSRQIGNVTCSTHSFQPPLTPQNANHIRFPKKTRTTSSQIDLPLLTLQTPKASQFKRSSTDMTPTINLTYASTLRNPSQSQFQNVKQKLIKQVHKVMNLNSLHHMKYKRVLLERRSVVEGGQSRFLGRKGDSRNRSQLTNFIQKELSTMEEKSNLIFNNRRINEDEIRLTRELEEYKDGFDAKHNMLIESGLGIREKLMVTGERNRALKENLRLSNPTRLIRGRIQKQKKLEDQRNFKKVFCKNLGRNFDNKKKIELYRYLKDNVLKNMTFSTPQKRPQNSRKKKAHSLREKKKTSTEKSASRKHKIRLQKIVSNKFKTEQVDLEQIFRSYPKFLEFLEKEKQLFDHYKKAQCQGILEKAGIRRLLQNSVFQRQELVNLTHDFRNEFKREQDLQKRVNLALILGTNLSFKIKSVFKEQGNLFCLILSQLAKDFEVFRQLVGKSIREISFENKAELMNLSKRNQVDKEYYDSQLQMVREMGKKKERRFEVKEEETNLMRKLIFELEQKNEKYLRIIQDLKSKGGFNRQVESKSVRAKFKNIIKKLLPGSAKVKKPSIQNVSQKLMKRHREESRQFQKYQSIGNKFTVFKPSQTSFKTSQTIFASKMTLNDNSLRRMQAKNFESRKGEALYSEDENQSRESNPNFNLLDVPEQECFTLPSFNSDTRESYLMHLQYQNNQKAFKGGVNRPRNTYSPRMRTEGVCSQCKRDASFQIRRMDSRLLNKRTETIENSAALPRIGKYLLSDIEDVSKFYLLPQEPVGNKGVQVGPSTRHAQAQTDISLVDPIFDGIFLDTARLKKFISEFTIRMNFSTKDICKRIADIKEIQLDNRRSERVSKSRSNFLRKSFKRFQTRRNCGLYSKSILRDQVNMSQPALQDRMSIRMNSLRDKHQKEIVNAPDVFKSAFNHSLMFHRVIQETTNSEIFRNLSDMDKKKLLSRNSIVNDKQDLAYKNTSEKTKRSKEQASRNSSGFFSTSSRTSGPLRLSMTKSLVVNLETICKEVFENYLKNEVLKEKVNVHSKEKLIKHITAFLMSEEMKNKNLLSKNNKYMLVFNMLKKIIRVPSSYNHLKRNRSFAKNVDEFSNQSEEESEAFAGPNKSKKKKLSKKMKRINSCPKVNWKPGKRKKVPLQSFSIRNNILGQPKFHKIWRSLYQFICIKIGKNKQGFSKRSTYYWHKFFFLGPISNERRSVAETGPKLGI